MTSRDLPSPELTTQRRIALLIATSVVLIQWLPSSPGEPSSAVPLWENLAIAGMFLLYAGLTTVEGLRRRGIATFELLLYLTGLWCVRIATTDAFSGGSVLSLVMATFGLGLCFRDAERMARFYLTVLAAISTVYLLGSRSARTDPTLVLAVLGGVMTVAYIVARDRDRVLGEANVLALVASHVHNGVVMTDPMGRITWINDGFTRMSGVGLGEVLGRSLVDTLGVPPTPPVEVERLRQAIAASRPITLEVARLRPDGSALWIALDVTPVRREGGGVERFVAIETDVSAAHAYVSEIQDAMSDLLFVVHADGTIRSANRAACLRLGVHPDEIVGTRLASYLMSLPRASELDTAGAPSDAATERLLDAVTLERGPLGAQGVEVGLRGHDGGVVAVHATVSELPAVGEVPRRAVIVARDISERRRLERERLTLADKARQTQKLESLGVLAGGIAHDFNNLLVGVLGNSSLLQMREGLDAESRELVSRIDDAAQRAADLTRQMLAYSGRGRFVIEPMDLSTIAAEMRRLVEAALSKRARLRMELSADLPAVEGDVTQVRQILMNLLTNASDALQDADGEIVLRTAVVTADRRTLASGVLDDDLAPGTYVLLEVSDTGVGMSDAVRRRMFEPFFTTKSVGRGLGLAATLGIVRGHKGAIRVRSEAGKGTTVSVLFPALNRRAETVTAPVQPESRRLGPTRVLVVDDEPAVLDLIGAVLRTLGAEVVTARDGVEALEIFRERPDAFSLVILDLTMPRMAGDEALRELRLVRPDVPVLLSSGYSEQEATSRFAGQGLAGFLQKPFRARQLVAQVRPILDRPVPA